MGENQGPPSKPDLILYDFAEHNRLAASGGENQQGTEYDLDINGFNMHIDMGFETGLNIADKFVVYGRWGLGLYPLTDEEDRAGYKMAAIYPMYLQVGLRIPFFNERL